MEDREILDLYDLMLEQIRDLYDGEQQQLEFLARAEEMADSFELIDIIESHRNETKSQIDRLESVFKKLEEDPSGESCEGISGLINEAMKLARRCKNPEVRDAGLITAIQHINHYEMAGYGTAVSYAKILDRHDIGEPLLVTLREEKAADMDLSEIAEEHINVDAKWTNIVARAES